MQGINVAQNGNGVFIYIDTSQVKPEKVAEFLKLAEGTETSQAENTQTTETGDWFDKLIMMPFKVQDGETFSRDEIYREQEDAIYGKGDE